MTIKRTLAKLARLFGVSDTAPTNGQVLIYNSGTGLYTPGDMASGGLTSEQVMDTIAAMLVAGTNVTLTYNDAANTLTIDSTGGGGGLTAEQVMDTIATMLVAGSNITLTYNDAGDSLTIASSGGSGGVTRIAQVITSGSQADVTFSGIPATYEDLIVIVNGRADKASASYDDLRMQVNADTGANYDSEGSEVNNTSHAGTPNLAANWWNIGWLPASTAPASTSGSAEIVIPNYRRTTFNKSMMHRCALKLSAAASGFFVRHGGGWWRNSAAIDTVKVFPLASNFVDGSVVTLYGRT